MDPPPPQIPQPFLQLCTKYEYFKRNPLTQSVQNLHQMINSELTRNAVDHLPVIENPEFEEDFFGDVRDSDPEESSTKKDDSPPPTKKRRTLESKEYVKQKDYQRPKTKLKWCAARKHAAKEDDINLEEEKYPDPDPDSDNSDIEDDDEKKPRIKSQIPLKLMKMWTRRFAELEIQAIEPERRLMAADFLRILSIRAAVPHEEYTEFCQLNSSTIHVTIAPRTIFINFDMEETYTMTSVQYWSHEEGCLFRWGNNVRLIKGVKYQQLAARQFYALVENPNTEIKTLRFSVKEFDAKHDPAQWPFRSFHRKIQKLLARRPGIQVENFDMMFHCYSGNAVEGEKILKSVLPYLDPETLIKIKLRVWDDHEILRMKDMSSYAKYFFIPTRVDTMEAQFRSAKEIDIYDQYIIVLKSNLLWLHNTVNCVLSTEDFIPLVQCCPVDQVKPGMCMEFLLDEWFDIEEAEEELRSSGLARSGRDLRIENGKINVVFSKKNERKRVEFIKVN
ncbi:hypothetical protein CAEBREN_25643 [Caenorhabditis brenneri]|uniref:DUF38 domain-containing protein n=1 Tax=Caenorhabditis brenneri TaxID=135651 RepID=G0NC43_CAEBE|nr:hypothetical protein CAEBREN_25643 [Caenorhabditis brenneri]